MMKETEQIYYWKGKFDGSYTERNSADFDQEYMALDEMFRVTKICICLFEYLSTSFESRRYMDNENKLRHRDSGLFLGRFKDLRPARQRKLKGLSNTDNDAMFLLEKK